MRLSHITVPTDNVNGTPIDGYNSGTTFQTTPQWLGYVFGTSTQVVFTGTLTGTIKLQASNDRERVQGVPDSNIVNWADITSATLNFSAGSPLIIDVVPAMFRWMRIVFTISSGSGVFTATIQIKAME